MKMPRTQSAGGDDEISSSVSKGAHRSTKITPAEASDVLIRMIKQEMMQSMIRIDHSQGECCGEGKLKENEDDADNNLEKTTTTTSTDNTEEHSIKNEMSELAEAVFSSADKSRIHDSDIHEYAARCLYREQRDNDKEKMNEAKGIRRASIGSNESKHSSKKTETSASIEMLLQSFEEISAEDYKGDETEENHLLNGEKLPGDDLSCISDLTDHTKLYPNAQVENSSVEKSNKKIMIEGIPEELNQNDVSAGGVVDNPRTNNQSKDDRKMQRHERFKRGNRTVRFGSVHIRYYNRIVCDNPAVTLGGPSIGLGWEYRESQTNRTVQEYDAERRPLRKPRALDLIMSKEEREHMVYNVLQIPSKDIAALIRATQRIQTQRRQTVNNIGAQKMEEVMERVGRKFKKLFSVS